MTISPNTAVAFEFDYYRFNGKSSAPSLVPTVNQANFIRSRYSIDETLVDLAQERLSTWAKENGVNTCPKKPYPSSQKGKYWVEFRLGGLIV